MQRQRGTALGHWIFYSLLKIVGRDFAGVLLYPVAFYFTFTSSAAVRASQNYLNKAAAFWQWQSVPGVFGHFLEFSRTLLDRAAVFMQTGGTFTFEFIGESYIREAVARGKGVLLVSAHAGNWEIAGNCLQKRLDVPVQIAMFMHGKDAHSVHLPKSSSGKLGIINLSDDEMAGVEMLRALRRGEIVAMHGDRFFPKSRVRREIFLGHPATFPEGPFQLAAISQAALVVCFAMRTGRRRYQLVAEPAVIKNPAETRAGFVSQAMTVYVCALEKIIKAYPMQWFNWYDFWKQ